MDRTGKPLPTEGPGAKWDVWVTYDRTGLLTVDDPTRSIQMNIWTDKKHRMKGGTFFYYCDEKGEAETNKLCLELSRMVFKKGEHVMEGVRRLQAAGKQFRFGGVVDVTEYTSVMLPMNPDEWPPLKKEAAA